MNESPTMYGKNIILRKPREQDKYDRLACGRTKELVRMYGGDTTPTSSRVSSAGPLNMRGAALPPRGSR